MHTIIYTLTSVNLISNPSKKLKRILDNLDPPAGPFAFFIFFFFFRSFFSVSLTLTRSFLCRHLPTSSYLIFSFYSMMTRMMTMSHWTSLWPELWLEAVARFLRAFSGYCQSQILALTGSSQWFSPAKNRYSELGNKFELKRSMPIILYHNYMLTFCSPSHHDSACSGLTRERLGISLAAQSMAAAAMQDGQYSRKLASVDIVNRKSILSILIVQNAFCS